MSTIETSNQQAVGVDVEPSIAVVEAVATREGVDPRVLDPPLNEVVDGDALDSLFADGATSHEASVNFSFCGYDVTVDADGDVAIEE